MDDRYRRATRLMALSMMLLFVEGCISHPSAAIPISGAPKASGVTTAATPGSTASLDAALLSNGSSTSTHPTTSSRTSSTRLTGAQCAAGVSRAVAAAVKLMPEGTKRTAQPTSTCRGDQLLEVTYPGSGKLTWTVRITIAASTAASCQSAAEGASAHCIPISGRPGMIGADVVCGGSQCEEAWLFAGSYLVDAFGYLTGPGGIPMTSHGLPGVLPIGIASLAALSS